MKPVNVLLLVLAGALGGAVVMKIAQPPRRPAPVAKVASTPAEKMPAPELAAASPAAVAQPETVAVRAAEPASPASRPVDDAPRPIDDARSKRPSPIENAAAPNTARNTMKPRRTAVARTEPSIMTRATPPAPLRQAPVLAEARSPARPEQPAAVVPPPVPAAPPISRQTPAASEPVQAVNAPPARMDPENATPAPAPQPAAPVPHTVTLNAGSLIPVRLVDSLSSDRNQAGDRFTASLDHELVADGFVIAERGARVEGQVVEVNRGTKIKGDARLSLELTAIFTSDDQYVPVETDAFEKRVEPDRRTDAEKIGGGAVLGAIIGAMAGGGKGAAIGAGAGGGAGAGDVALTRKPAALGSETRISFRVRNPVTITERVR